MIYSFISLPFARIRIRNLLRIRIRAGQTHADPCGSGSETLVLIGLILYPSIYLFIYPTIILYLYLSIHLSGCSSKSKTKRVMYDSAETEDFDREEVPTYEVEVLIYPLINLIYPIFDKCSYRSIYLLVTRSLFLLIIYLLFY